MRWRKAKEKFISNEVDKMLDLGKTYFVSIGRYSREKLECWAKKNAIGLTDEETRLPCCGKVYRVNVAGNEKLDLPKKLQGSVRQNLVNGTNYIGGVVCSGERVVIFPAIG